MQLLARGAEADIYLTNWHGLKAAVKVRSAKSYRHRDLDNSLRRQRTLHEATIISAAKLAGVATPFVYFVDPLRATIVMEYVSGVMAKDVLDATLCREMGKRAAALHACGIVHGDLTTSNFLIAERGIVLVDFGLAHFSTRSEDMATDVRLTKEALSSAHARLKGGFDSFINGYQSVVDKRTASRVVSTVSEIERRGRYARLE